LSSSWNRVSGIPPRTLLQQVVGRRRECSCEGVQVVRHKTILDALVLVSAGTPWN
jgi:hypothetical protein